MDSLNLRLLFVFTDLVLPLIVGYTLHQRHLVNDKAITKLIKFNIVVISTVLSLLSFWVIPLSWDLLWVPACGFLLVLVPGLIGTVLFARRFPDMLDRGAYIASSMLTNLGTLGGVCAFILYNEVGFAYTQLVGTCQNFLLCLIVFPMAQYCYMKATNQIRKTNRLHMLREMFLSWNQLCVVGMFLGLLLNGFGVERPAVLGTAFQGLVHVGAWIAMLPVGFLIELQQVKKYARRVASLNILRFVISPAFFWGIGHFFIADPVFRNTLLILSFCPTAVNAVLSSKLYHLNYNIATSSFFITHAVFLFFIYPILFFLLK